MYEETACFDPNNISMLEGTATELPLPQSMMAAAAAAAASRTNSHSGGGGYDDDGHNVVDLTISSMAQDHVASAIEIELERELQMDMQQHSHQNLNDNEFFVMQQQQQQMIHHHHHQQQQQQQLHDPNQIDISFNDQSNWEQIELQNVNNQQYHQHQFQHHQMLNSPSSHPHPTADLLNLFHLPNSSLSYAAAVEAENSLNFHNSLSSLTNNPVIDNTSSSVMYDPLFHLNLPPQPPMFRELFQTNTYNLTGSRLGSSIFGDEREASGGVVYQGGDSGILEFTAAEVARRGRGRNGKSTPHFTTDRHRRTHLNNRYQALKDLVPNPTKNDRASIVQDAIEYINEQMRTVNELKILVEKKRCSRERRKRHKTGEGHGEEGTKNIKHSGGGSGGDSTDQYYNEALLSSWIQRKTKDTEVDVRIIDDDVTIKLVQRKKINCLLLVSKFLDELHLDIQHVAGGHIGDFYSFLFNTKIYEGSSLYASAIANKLVEVVDKQYAATPSNSSY